MAAKHSTVSPLEGAEGVLRVSVRSNGNPVDAQAQLLSATVRRQLNRVPSATLVFSDGDMPTQTFPLSDGDRFQPGAEITLAAGWGDDESVIFKGVVVRHGIRIQGDNDSRLVVECRDAAVAMTVAHSHATFTGMTDAEVMQALIGAHAGLTPEVSGADQQHAQLIQHGCSDWDFLLARAHANGCVVTVTDGVVKVAEPDFSGPPPLSVAYGESLIAFEAALDARRPHAQGRMTFTGSARAVVGGPIRLSGVGARFNGDVFVTGVSHTLADGDWTSECDFGLAPVEPGESTGPAESARGEGLQVGMLTRLDGDPEGSQRVQVKLPAAGPEPVWARLAQPQAGRASGALFLPEVGDEVLVGFLQTEPRQPVVLGSLCGTSRTPAIPPGTHSGTKAIVTRGGHRLAFDDDARLISLTTPSRNHMVFSDQDASVTLGDAHGNRVVLGRSGIVLDSTGDVAIRARGAITLDAVGALHIRSQADLKAEGLNVACTAQVGFSATGAASAELSAAGQTTVKGALVMIN